jgi:hypothetical protein
MDFYTSLFAGTIVFLIIILAIMGYFMATSRSKEVYPPTIADCPDYYSLDPKGVCNIGKGISVTDPSCNSQSFKIDPYIATGTGTSSGLCAKKMWAGRCGVTWDGVSNNDRLCYSDYVKPTK